MPLISFIDYLESSPSTRNKTAAANGTQPMYSADVFGHSTPAPDVVKKLKKKLKKKKKGTTPNYSFDAFIKKAESTMKDIKQDIEQAKKKDIEQDNIAKSKENEIKEKEKLTVATKKTADVKADTKAEDKDSKKFAKSPKKI
jgi:hypothetical protein